MDCHQSKEDEVLKHFWCATQFSLNDSDVLNREKADTLRQSLFFLQQLLAIKKINETTYGLLHKNLSLQYSSLMDSEKGLDNYSEMMTALTSGKTNESQVWMSGLSLDIDRQPQCVKDLLCKEKKQSRNMKICFSKRACGNHKDNRSPSMSSDKTPIPNQQNILRKEQAQTAVQRSLQEHPQIPSMNDMHVPRFGKRKQINPEEGYAPVDTNKQAKKNSFVYGKSNSCMKPPSNDRTKAIVYRRDALRGDHCEDDGNSHKDEMQAPSPFLTAGQKLKVDMKKSGKMPPSTSSSSSLNYGQGKKSLGARRGVSGKFVPPIGQEKSDRKQVYGEGKGEGALDSKYEEFEWMKNVDPKMVELIENEIMDHGPQVSWDDIAGLEFAKTTIQEIVIWPMLRPDIFTGLRGPPKGLLLFGPPGTGKTLIGKCIASQSNAQFFNISASSLTSKWIGEGEKMVRALFGVARCQQPAVIFIDEIDSLLTQRSEGEHESSRRIKTEFLVQLDGATASSEDRLLVVGATNRPQELDEAARRRLVKRLYIPLPDGDARKHIVTNLMCNQPNDLHDEDLDEIMDKTSGFSGSDMANLCREAALGPIRNISDIRNINADEVRPVNKSDFVTALKHVRPSVSQNDLQQYVEWNRLYGSGGGF